MDRHSILVGMLVAMLVMTLPVMGVAGISSDEHDLECDFPLTVTDGTDTEVSLEEPPERIVVTHASTAQIADEIGVWDRVVGAPVNPFTAYIDGHDEPRDVTDDEGWPVVEQIIDLDPDLVLVGHVGDVETVDVLRDEDITVYMHEAPEDVDDIMHNVETTGALTDACEGADESIGWMEERLDHVDSLVGDEQPLVYYELGGGWTTGAGTFQHDMIERAGAENLGAVANLTGWKSIGEETVVDLDPDWIMYGDTVDEPPVSEAIHGTTAMEQNQTIAVDTNFVNQAGPKVVLVIEAMAEEMHDAEATDASANEPLPGFGVAAGVLGLVLTLLVRRSW